jgi:hypothetical protein
MSVSLNATCGSLCRPSRQQREGAVVEFHHHALERLLRLLVRNLEQLQKDRLVLPSISSRRDAEQQRIADLAGGAGDGDTDGRFTHGFDLRWMDRRCASARPREDGRGRGAGSTFFVRRNPNECNAANSRES